MTDDLKAAAAQFTPPESFGDDIELAFGARRLPWGRVWVVPAVERLGLAGGEAACGLRGSCSSE